MIQELQTLTELELNMLQQIVDCYDETDNICYDCKLTTQEKGIVGSLVKKGLVYDSRVDYDNKKSQSNFFPIDEAIEFLKSK